MPVAAAVRPRRRWLLLLAHCGSAKRSGLDVWNRRSVRLSGDVKRLDRHRLDADSETTDLLVAWNSVLRNNTPNEQTDYYGDYQRHQEDVQDQHDALPVRAVAQRRNLSFGGLLVVWG